MGRIGRSILGIAFGACLGVWTAWATDSPRAVLIAVPVAVVAILGANSKTACALLRALAWLHVAVALLAIRVHTEQVEGAIDKYLSYVFMNVSVPAFTIAFLMPPSRSFPTAGLPAGYDYLDPARRRLGPFDRAFIVFLVSFCAATFMAGWLLLAVIVVPTGFALLYVLQMLRTRRTAPPTAPRRVKVSPKMQKPAQTRSYYTVNDSEFDDPNLFDQK